MTATLKLAAPYLLGLTMMIAGAFLLSLGCIVLVRLVLRLAGKGTSSPADGQEPSDELSPPDSKQ